MSSVCREVQDLAWLLCFQACCLEVLPGSDSFPSWISGLVFRGPGVELEEKTLCLYSRGCLLRAIAKAIKKYIFCCG